jgi:hypothetical protein
MTWQEFTDARAKAPASASALTEEEATVDEFLKVSLACSRIGDIVADTIVAACPGLSRERVAEVTAFEVYAACRDAVTVARSETEQA